MSATKRFYVAQQATSARYTIHVFESRLHFQAWMKVYHACNMRPASQARGCKHLEVNHIGECDYAVMDKQTELECAQ